MHILLLILHLPMSIILPFSPLSLPIVLDVRFCYNLLVHIFTYKFPLYFTFSPLSFLKEIITSLH
ncbi:hypothetical protein J3E69DRAFT_346546 [Trichoderma sp. SZMC 28015]